MTPKRKRGRPTKRSAEVEDRIVEGLSQGTPLTLICQPADMPGLSTVYDWMNADADFSGRVARARDAGWDRIAMEALSIADEVDDRDTITTEFGERPNKEWIMRSKLRVETRLKLLSKWDAKRYGDKIEHEHTGGIAVSVTPEDAGL